LLVNGRGFERKHLGVFDNRPLIKQKGKICHIANFVREKSWFWDGLDWYKMAGFWYGIGFWACFVMGFG
jgi:hypothetical protein